MTSSAPTTTSTFPRSSSSSVPGPVLRLGAGGRIAHVVMTSMADGDLAVSGDPATLETRRRAVVDLPWTWLHQEHGAAVVVVDRPGQHAGERADAAVSALPGAALAVQVADCAPVALVSSAGAVGIAHVGWRGLVAGVLPAAASALMALGEGIGEVRAVIGPCIHCECYEFGESDLDRVAAVAGDSVRARTADGRAALDLVAGIEHVARSLGIGCERSPWDSCTSCSAGYWSHRARGDRARRLGAQPGGDRHARWLARDVPRR
ncbi:MAG: laccase domain-containing protein, partial [Actinobacteria bacterium]